MANDSRLRLLEEFLDQLAHQRRLSPGTARNYRRALEQLFALNHGVSLRRLEAQHLRRTISLLHARGMSGRTIAYLLSGWRGFFSWLVKHRGLAHRAREARNARGNGAFRRRARPAHQRELGALRSCTLGAASRPAAARPPAYAASLLRHAPAPVFRGPARGAGNARAFEHLDHAGLHPS